MLARYFPDCEIVLHLGAHRTGTTVLQAQLDAADFSNRGISALTPPRAGDRKPVSLRSAFSSFQKVRRNPLRIGLRLHALRSIRRLIGEGVTKKLIVSDEMLLGPIFDNNGDGIYPDAAQWLNDCARFLGPNVSQVHLVHRPYADFLTSAYAMRAVYARGVGQFDKYRAGFLRCKRGWPDVVQDISAAFPYAQQKLWAFPEQLNESRLFLWLTGIEKAPPLPTYRNKSTSSEGIDYALRHKRDLNYDPDTLAAEFSKGTVFAPFTFEETMMLNSRYLEDRAIMSRMMISQDTRLSKRITNANQ